MSKYVRVTEGLKDFGDLIPLEELDRDLVSEKDCYTSVFYYNEEQYKQFKKTGSVKGITDVYTDKLVFDFDSKTDLNLAKQDANTLVERLNKNNIENKNIDVYFSGSKGFTVIVNLNHELNPTQAATLALKKFGKDLITLDPSMYNASRILRLPNTKHQVTGLYKVQLTLNQLKKLSIDTIKEVATKAKQLEEKEKVSLTAELLKVEEPKKEIKEVKSQLERRPPHWKDYKWALLQGQFEPGERHNALMIIAATCRGLGYDEELTRAMCTSSDEKFCSRTKSKPSDDIDSSIKSVFDEGWNGGQYSYKNNAFLQQYCARNGFGVEKEDDIFNIHQIQDGFVDYVKNIDKNTILTGIKRLDEELPITTGIHLGIVGAASSGKTALALEILKNTSNNNVVSVIASLDMHRNRLFEKLLYKESGLNRKELFQKIQDGTADHIFEKVKKNYKNVYFYDRSCPSVSNVREYIENLEKNTGSKVKLVMIDYFERLNSEKSDETAASKDVGGQLQDLVNDLNVALITLVQPNKFSLSAGPDTAITSYTAIKGSSFLYQSFRAIVSIWRPFFNPETKDNDNYLQMAILKNDLGELNIFNFNWAGRKGEISEMTDEQESIFQELLKEKNQKKSKDKGDWD